MKANLQAGEELLSEELSAYFPSRFWPWANMGNLVVTSKRILYEPSVLSFFLNTVEIQLAELVTVSKARCLGFSPTVCVTTTDCRTSYFSSFSRENLIETITSAAPHLNHEL
jgi:hypothetical protein